MLTLLFNKMIHQRQAARKTVFTLVNIQITKQIQILLIYWTHIMKKGIQCHINVSISVSNKFWWWHHACFEREIHNLIIISFRLCGLLLVVNFIYFSDKIAALGKKYVIGCFSSQQNFTNRIKLNELSIIGGLHTKFPCLRTIAYATYATRVPLFVSIANYALL